MRAMPDIDRLILAFDSALRAVGSTPIANRSYPAATLPEGTADPAQRRASAALMRVNHSGEVCAQALYQGQSLASKNEALKRTLQKAADEEEDHLAWSARRIEELGGRTSLLNPLWYLGSLAIGYAAGRVSDEWNLGFLQETEKQVERHLEGHLAKLDAGDARTRAVVSAMKEDEAAHAQTAGSLGARELPQPVKAAMALASKVMTTIAYRI
jgi:3-demethoxyubiquinol 3-hydroxylase